MTEHERTIDMLTRCFERQWGGLPEWRRQGIDEHYEAGGPPCFLPNMNERWDLGYREDAELLWWLSVGNGSRVEAAQRALVSVKTDCFYTSREEAERHDARRMFLG